MPSDIIIVNVKFKSGQEVTIPVTKLQTFQSEDLTKYTDVKWENVSKLKLRELRKEYPELKLGHLESLNVSQVEAITTLDTIEQ